MNVNKTIETRKKNKFDVSAISGWNPEIMANYCKPKRSIKNNFESFCPASGGHTHHNKTTTKQNVIQSTVTELIELCYNHDLNAVNIFMSWGSQQICHNTTLNTVKYHTKSILIFRMLMWLTSVNFLLLLMFANLPSIRNSEADCHLCGIQRNVNLFDNNSFLFVFVKILMQVCILVDFRFPFLQKSQFNINRSRKNIHCK